jgi:hypothetical protein
MTFIPNTPPNDSFDRLTELLLQGERMRQEDFDSALQKLKAELQSEENWKERVEPIIQNYLLRFKKEFPEVYGPVITNALKNQVKEAEAEIVEALFPIMGKMIRRYVGAELDKVRQSINETTTQLLTPEGIMRFIKGKISGVSTADMSLSMLKTATISEILIIDQKTSFVLGSHPLQQDMDKDMVAGMLSAIKSFMQDAFKAKQHEVEQISYGEKQMVFYNTPAYFITVVVEGNPTQDEVNILQAQMAAFSERFHKIIINHQLATRHYVISLELKDYFGL